MRFPDTRLTPPAITLLVEGPQGDSAERKHREPDARQGAHGEMQLLPYHQGDAAQPQYQSRHLDTVDALSQQRQRQSGRQQRLHPDDERRQARLEAQLNGRKHAAEIDAVEQ